MTGPSRGDGRDAFRPDIEGLRGVAVLLVVLFHGALIGALPGGYIGVDVFFVISGFLITGLLVRERERSGTVSLSAFYARRARRLLPAGLTVLVVTLVASFVVLAPLDRASVALDAGAAALSIGNVRFASAEGDYFTSLALPSPFLHYWSLAVEEQFYLVWPAIVLLATRLRRPRVGAGAVLALILAGSFVMCLAASGSAVTWAFYSLPTRAWQLSLGGLIAIGGAHISRLPRSLTVIVGWGGLVAILAASAGFDTSLAYPGAWALVPTAGAAAIIAAGLDPLGPGRLLGVPTLRLVGRISYSLYLWHWPLLVLPTVALESEPPLAVRFALVGLAFVVAWLSWRFVEEPFRSGFPSLARRPMRTVVAGVAAILTVVVAAGGLTVAADRVPQLMPELVAVAEPAAPTETLAPEDDLPRPPHPLPCPPAGHGRLPAHRRARPSRRPSPIRRHHPRHPPSRTSACPPTSGRRSDRPAPTKSACAATVAWPSSACASRRTASTAIPPALSRSRSSEIHTRRSGSRPLNRSRPPATGGWSPSSRSPVRSSTCRFATSP